MSEPIRVVIHGAAGRMGLRLVALASVDRQLKVTGALERPGHPALGQDVGLLAGVARLEVPVSVEAASPADVVIDFSTPAGAMAALAFCRERKLPLVMATTGLEPEQVREVEAATKVIPVVWSPSMSLAVNLAMKLTEISSRALADHPSGADVEIIERHHRFKEDAPSGTALKFGQIVTEAMGQRDQRHGRHGRPGPRPQAEIGYHAVRVGDNPGEHTIIFGLLGETLELTVKASNRDCYAQGALAAARWVVGKKPGRYGMADVLGL